jgi:hypothetical protein
VCVTYLPIWSATENGQKKKLTCPHLLICSSALAILVARYLLALTAADQLQAQVPLLIVVSLTSFS